VLRLLAELDGGVVVLLRQQTHVSLCVDRDVAIGTGGKGAHRGGSDVK